MLLTLILTLILPFPSVPSPDTILAPVGILILILTLAPVGILILILTLAPVGILILILTLAPVGILILILNLTDFFSPWALLRAGTQPLGLYSGKLGLCVLCSGRVSLCACCHPFAVFVLAAIHLLCLCLLPSICCVCAVTNPGSPADMMDCCHC